MTKAVRFYLYHNTIFVINSWVPFLWFCFHSQLFLYIKAESSFSLTLPFVISSVPPRDRKEIHMPKRKTNDVDFSLGNNLYYYRNKANLTQQQVADYLNINRTTYTKYETHVSEPCISTLRKLVELFEIDFNSLFKIQNNNWQIITLDIKWRYSNWILFSKNCF